MSLRREHHERFQADGYVVVPRHLPLRWLDEVTGTVQAKLDEGILSAPPPDTTDLWSASCLMERIPALRPLLLDASVLGLVEAIIGPRPRVASNRYICRPGGCHEFIPWHRDNEEYAPLAGQHGVTVWIPTVDVHQNNGCLWYAPGSQRGAPGASTCALMQRGDVAIHSMGTLHMAGSNRSTSPRPAVVLEFVDARATDAAGAPLGFDPAIELP